MSSEDTFTDELGFLKPAHITRSDYHNNLEDIDEEIASKGDRVGGTIDPDRLRPNGQPYVDVTNDAYGIEPGGWYSGWDGTTDHTQAIQDAYDRARDDLSQATLYFPGGEYYISSPIEIDSSTTIIGSGVRSSRIVATEPMEQMIVYGDDDGPTAQPNNVHIGWLELECNDNAQYGVDLTDIHRWSLYRLFIRGAAEAGVKLHRSWVGGAYFVNVGAGSKHAVEAGMGMHNISFTNCPLGYVDEASVVAGPEIGGYQLVFRDCQFEGTVAFDLTDETIRIWCENCLFEREGSPIIQIDNIPMFVLDGGSYNGRVSAFADIRNTDLRINDFHMRAATDNVVQLRLQSTSPTDLGLRYRDGTIRLSPSQIRYTAQPRLTNSFIDPSEGVLDTDSDDDGVADGWTSTATNSFMSAGVVGGSQRIETHQHEHIRYSFSELDPGTYTVCIIYRIFNPDEGNLEPRLESGDDSDPIRYTGGSRAELPVSTDEAWHISNFNIDVEAGDSIDGFRIARPDDSANTVNADIQGVQIYQDEHHVGSITPYDADM